MEAVAKKEKRGMSPSLKIVVVLTAVALIAGLLLSVVHMFTQVDEEARFREKLGNLYGGALTDKAFDIAICTPTAESEIIGVYQAENGAAVILSKSKKAFDAATGIELIVIIKDRKVEAVYLNKAAETPGLGTKALTNAHLAKYAGYSVDAFNTGGESIGTSVSVPGVTGATKSSNGVRIAVEAAVRAYLQFEKAGEF